MFASFDPVAVDQAAADACNRQPALANSVLAENLAAAHAHTAHDGRDHFAHISPNTHWQDTLAHAEKIGIGTRAYELVTVR
jgi:uncharacterized Fe-S center protein